MSVTQRFRSYNKAPELQPSFKYPDLADPIFKKLLSETNIIFSDGVNGIERAKAIVGYVHRIFSHDSDNVPSSYDPLTILREAKSGKSFRCVEYSLLSMWLLWAYGIPARRVGLKTADVETREYGAGHVVVELWDYDYKKWVMSDVQAGIIPSFKDVPLSSVELADLLDQKQIISCNKVKGSRFMIDGVFMSEKNYLGWLGKYLYFFDVPLEDTLAKAEINKETQILMLVPLEVKPPVMFQKMFAMNAVYTRSTADFYPQLNSSQESPLHV